LAAVLGFSNVKAMHMAVFWQISRRLSQNGNTFSRPPRFCCCRYWHTSKQQRALDYGLTVRDRKMLDGEGKVVYELPENDNYSGWAGYKESAHVCRVTGPPGVVKRKASDLWCV
jgi:hypothetical protein